MPRRAFTLVELLVVIAIIGLLSTVAVINLGSSRTKARNAKRIADIKQLISAFNLGLDANGSYPAIGPVCMSTICSYGWSQYSGNGTVDAFISPYMASKPVDPMPSPATSFNGYLYIGGWGGGTAPYSGTAYSAGNILNWALEGSVDCSPGYKWEESGGASNCIIYL